MDVLDSVERFLAERKKRNKRRKGKRNENPYIEIRTKSGLSVGGDLHGLTKDEIKIREFVFQTKYTSFNQPYDASRYTGRMAIIDRREIEAVFAGQSFTAP